jgi:methyl-accepting chemotaxis protein
VRLIIKKSIVRTNFMLSIGFGILMGICFPLYSVLFVNFKSDMLKTIFCISCIFAGIIVGLTAFLINFFTILRVMKSLSNDLKEIANGEGDLTKSIKFQSDDDVGGLVHWFNMFVNKLGVMINASKHSVMLSRKEFENLTTQMTGISGTLQNIVDISIKVREIQDEQNSKMENMENSLKVLDDSIIIVITNVMEFFNHLDMLSNIVMNQSRSIDEVILNIEGISKTIGERNRDEVLESGNSLSTLYATGYEMISRTSDLAGKSMKNSSTIGDYLGKIEDLSVSINLISINASIEAARSGEAGRGFHVVSGEIRKFANLTKQYANEIQNVLKKMTSDIESGSAAIRDKREGYEGILNDVTATTEGLKKSAGDIKSVTEDIKANYMTIGDLLVNLKNKIECLKTNSGVSHTTLDELKDITGMMRSRIEVIVGKSKETSINNVTVLGDFYDFMEGFKSIETEINRYKTQP